MTGDIPKKETLTIGVSGASGHLGQSVVQAIAERGPDHRLIAISRSSAGLEPLEAWRFGDYNAPHSLLDAYSGLDRVLLIPSLDLSYGARARQLVTAIDAANKAGVGQVVLISDASTRREAEPAVGAASWIAEQHLIKTARSWVILRANYFMESFAQEVALWKALGFLPELGSNRIGFVSREDLALAAAGILLGEDHCGAIYNATGPASLTTSDRIAIIAEATGSALDVRETTPDELSAILKAADYPEAYIDLTLDTKRKTVNGGFDIVTGDIERLSGRPPRTLKEVLQMQRF